MKEIKHSMTKIVKQLRGGQITIPVEFRERLGIGSESLLRMNLIHSELRLTPIKVGELASGTAWLKELRDVFTPVHAEGQKYTEGEINDAIDQAIKSVRKNA